MQNYIIERCLKLADFTLETKSPVRESAKIFGLSKSTVHLDLSKRLSKIDVNMHEKVMEIFCENFENKHIKGGISTREKYKKN